MTGERDRATEGPKAEGRINRRRRERRGGRIAPLGRWCKANITHGYCQMWCTSCSWPTWEKNAPTGCFEYRQQAIPVETNRAITDPATELSAVMILAGAQAKPWSTC